MREYRIYLITANHHINGPAKIIECDGDDEAIEQAGLFVDGKIVEVWNGARLVGRLGEVLRFIPRNRKFNPKTTALLCRAFDRAIEAHHDRGLPDIVKELMATHIVTLAVKGERDPDRLYKAALTVLEPRAGQVATGIQTQDRT